LAKKNNLAFKAEPFENFLNEHFLYRGVHKNLWQYWSSLDKIQPHFFASKQAEQGLSTDWSKYSTPLDILNNLTDPILTVNGIVELKIEKLKASIIQNNFPLTIAHNPLPKNRAHTLIHGIHKGNVTKIRRKISKITEWAPGMKPKI